jgi:hypothetical protein
LQRLAFFASRFAFYSGQDESGRPRKPDRIPPKLSSQIQDGFAINSDLPREPYLPWNRWWWTRIFDAGFSGSALANTRTAPIAPVGTGLSSNVVLSSSQELEDAVDSLVDNGVQIQVQLLYGNPMYTAWQSASCPTRSLLNQVRFTL